MHAQPGSRCKAIVLGQRGKSARGEENQHSHGNHQLHESEPAARSEGWGPESLAHDRHEKEQNAHQFMVIIIPANYLFIVVTDRSEPLAPPFA